MDKMSYGDNRWHVVYGIYEGVEKTAVDIIYGAVSSHTKYILTASGFEKTGPDRLSEVNPVLIGTAKSNPLIASLIEKGDMKTAGKPGGYGIKVMKNPFNGNRQIAVIAGDDESGVLYGAVDFKNKYIPQTGTFMLNNGRYFNNPFDGEIPSCEIVSSPSVADRAIWTWGHVIYDYRKFIDNMAALKMNMLVVWNDFVPINASDLVSYAHSRGVRVIWGYSWGWGVDLDLSNQEQIDKCVDEAVEAYESNYAKLDGDGIYFQSFTETSEEESNGVMIAKAVVDMVNRIGGRILDRHPDLEIQFGLHATSVRNKLAHIENVDERIHIIWEDCGAFPYHYSPAMTEDFNATLDFSASISSLRGENEKFGVVLKGLTCLDWTTFEHQKGGFVLGRESTRAICERQFQKSEYWRNVNSWWLRNAGYVLETVKLINSREPSDITVEALIEDGLFEETVPYAAAVLSEILWDHDRDIADILGDAALATEMKI